MAASLFAFRLDTATGGELRPETMTAAANNSDELEIYDTLPSVMFATTTPERATMISTLPGVRSFRPSTHLARQLVWSINQQLLIALVHGGTLGRNGIADAVPGDALVDGKHPGYPTLRLVNGGPLWGTDPTVALNTRYCFVGALSISLEYRHRTTYEPVDPVSLALSDASRRFPVALAAGNVNSDSDPTMFAWPLNPDVVAVGAVTPDGTELLKCSRVGDPSAGIAGPDVVANGIDETGKEGTSYATPVVSSQLAQIAAALMAVRTSCLSGTQAPEGVPLAGRCFVDFDRATAGGHAHEVTDFGPRRRLLPALPLGAVNTAAAEVLANHPAGQAFRSRPGPEALRGALIASAQPVHQHEPHQVGAGYVSDATTLGYLKGMTIERLAVHYGLDARGLTVPVFDADLLPHFLEGVRDSMIGWATGVTDFTDSGGSIFVEPPPSSPDNH